MLQPFRIRAEEFLEELARERYRLSVAQLREPAIAELYARSGSLFDRERISEVQRELSGATGEEERRIRLLLEFLVFQHAECAAAEELNQYHTWRNRTSVVVGESRTPLWEVTATIAGSSDPGYRAALGEGLLEALDEQVDLLESLIGLHRDTVAETGYGSFVQCCEFLSGIDLRALAREGEEFLTRTEGLYRELLGWFLRRVAEVEAVDASAAEVWRLLRAQRFDALFPGGGILKAARRALQPSGLDPLASGDARLEEHAELTASAGVVCHSLRVPEEVVLAVLARPRPGRPTAAAELYHLGYALQRGRASPDLPFEYRRLGDESVPHAFGRVFQGLLSVSPWLQRVHGTSAADRAEYLRFTALLDLLRTRQDVAQLQFEIELYGAADLRAGAEQYAERLTEATGLRHDPRAALASVTPVFRVARKLRSEQLSTVIGAQLRERFDEDWFRNPLSGEFVTGLCAHGQQFNASEMCVQLTSSPLSFEPVLARLTELSA